MTRDAFAQHSHANTPLPHDRKLRVLNLYAGIGGNRKLWGNVHVTAVEHDANIAAIYKEYYPDDIIIISDAHEYLLQHYGEFDFIWSSPPCPTHSRARYWSSKGGLISPKYPDWHLWQEILFLKHFARCPWVVENVISYYKPFILPEVKIDKHYLWANFYIPFMLLDYPSNHEEKIKVLKTKFKLDLKGMVGINKKQVMRNTVNPELGLNILKRARCHIRNLENTNQSNLKTSA